MKFQVFLYISLYVINLIVCGFFAQVMLTGRAMRIKLSGNCATVTDLDSGYKANKCSDNSQVSVLVFH